MKLFFCIILLFFVSLPVYAETFVGSLIYAHGNIDIKRNDVTILVTENTVLHDGDTIKTGKESHATILLRDDSEIRVLSNTVIQIEKSYETKKNLHRKFLNRIRIKKGRIWARLVAKQQQSIFYIQKSKLQSLQSILNLEVKEKQFSISVSSGQVQIENQIEAVTLKAGKMLRNKGNLSKLKDYVEDIPYQLILSTNEPIIKVPKEGKKEIPIVVQFIKFNTGDYVYKAEKIYFSSIIDKFVFPENTTLNKRGYARVIAEVYPFQISDYHFGQVSIFVVSEGDDFIETGTGSLLLRYIIPDFTRSRVLFDLRTGRVED